MPVVMSDENGNAHLANALMTNKPQRQQTSESTFQPTTTMGSSSTNNKPPPKSARETHTQRILHLDEDKLTASYESRRIVNAIKEMYHSKLLPLEQKYNLHPLCLPTSGAIQDAEFDAKPMVLLLGQYSTGKTSFIRHLLGQDFPGMHIGPEPTSDKFMALIHSERKKDNKIVKGNTLTVMPELPFFGLSQFGSSFLNHFNGSVTDSPLLQFMNMVDTPGILSGEKQRLSRDYPFSETAKWFADRADLILLLFDAHKLDISDEFKEVVETIRPHNDDKIRCVLNKADAVGKDQLVRVYGSLLWSMGKLFQTPEVVRVYTGSYWDQPLLHDDFQDMFHADEEWLLDELMRLPSVSAERKVNAIVKRIRLVKVHLCLLGYLRQQMPKWYGHAAKRRELLEDLPRIMETVRNHYHLPAGDMPNVDDFRARLEASVHDFTKIPMLDQSELQVLEDMLMNDLPAIMKGGGKSSSSSSSDEVLDKKKTTGESTAEAPVTIKSRALVVEDFKSTSASSSTMVAILKTTIYVILNLFLLLLLGALAYFFANLTILW